MAEKTKTNIEKYHEKRRLEKLQKEGKITKEEATEMKAIAETPDVSLKSVLEEKAKIDLGMIKCKKCGNVYDEKKAVRIEKPYYEDGCPKCGWPLSLSK